MTEGIAIDFDNTLACYDQAFCRVALDQNLLTEKGLSKTQVKSHLHAQNRHDDWTRLQGLVYGPEIHQAHPFEGALDFIRAACGSGRRVFVVSHKTRTPVLGEPHDLHAAARGWLQANGFWEEGLCSERVFFEESLEAKLRRLGQLDCQLFVDDLPEVLEHSEFPDGTRPWLFDPSGLLPLPAGCCRLRHWREALQWLE